jgi:hypothetical protein
LSGGVHRTSKPSWLTAIVTSAVTALPLLGCADHIFRPFDVDRGESLSVDARQRVILVTHKGGRTRDRTIVCTEPSPDAATGGRFASGNVAASLPPAAPGKDVQVAAATASSEATALIAMRTQTVQLLRDGLYRACEAYMNGAIDQHQYNIVLLNIDKLMVTLLGVDAVGAMQAKSQEAKEVQAEALTDMLSTTSAQSSAPALCISLLASGQLRLDNPGQQAVLARCDYLLAGTFEHLVRQQQAPAAQYVASAASSTAVVHSREWTPASSNGRTDGAVGNWTTSMAPPDVGKHPLDRAHARHGWDRWTVHYD